MKKFIEWAGVITCILGMLLLSEKIIIAGFVVNIISQILWGIFAYITRSWGLLVLELVLCLISINGIIS